MEEFWVVSLETVLSHDSFDERLLAVEWLQVLDEQPVVWLSFFEPAELLGDYLGSLRLLRLLRLFRLLR